jgi:hypothetical protein
MDSWKASGRAWWWAFVLARWGALLALSRGRRSGLASGLYKRVGDGNRHGTAPVLYRLTITYLS